MDPRGHVGTNRVAGSLITVALLMAALPAHAAFGNGIRVGGAEGRLHPFVELELRYDSNVASYYQPAQTFGGDLILHVRPGLLLNVPGDTVAVDLRAMLDWAQYFGMKDTVTRDLSNLFATVSLGVGFNRRGQLGLEIDEKFARSNQPTVYSIATGIISNYNDLSLSAPWRPGGGALSVTLSGDWAIESFEAFKPAQVCSTTTGSPFCVPDHLADLGYNNLGVGLGVNWKFLPKTSALLDLSWFDRVPNSTLYSIAGTGMRAQAGASGLITTHLAATLKGGYGTTLGLTLDPAAVPQADLSRFGTWLALVSAEWIPSSLSTLKLTWNHDLGFDPGTTWALYTSNHVSLEGKSKLNSVLAAAVLVDWALLDYRDAAKSTSNVITARPSLQAELSRWMMLELAYQYTDRTTDAANAPPGWKYSKHEAWLRAVVIY
jgi:Putative beta-barrel porin 2